MDGDVPAVFQGQMPIEDAKLFHDNGVAYLFFHRNAASLKPWCSIYGCAAASMRHVDHEYWPAISCFIAVDHPYCL